MCDSKSCIVRLRLSPTLAHSGTSPLSRDKQGAAGVFPMSHYSDRNDE